MYENVSEEVQDALVVEEDDFNIQLDHVAIVSPRALPGH